jgi:hypothetical protein
MIELTAKRTKDPARPEKRPKEVDLYREKESQEQF